MGDNITVEVYRVDSFKKQVDFRLVQTEEARPGRAHRQRDERPRQDGSGARGRDHSQQDRGRKDGPKRGPKAGPPPSPRDDRPNQSFGKKSAPKKKFGSSRRGPRKPPPGSGPTAT
jgi:hypothetical protein